MAFYWNDCENVFGETAFKTFDVYRHPHIAAVVRNLLHTDKNRFRAET